MKDKIRKALEALTEAPRDKFQRDDKGTEDSHQVYTLLKNPIYNHAAIMDKLWPESGGGENASNRSKFEKKFKGATNDAGNKYRFDDAELAKISSILLDTSEEARSSLGKKKSK